jgi:hypothetical protein
MDIYDGQNDLLKPCKSIDESIFQVQWFCDWQTTLPHTKQQKTCLKLKPLITNDKIRKARTEECFTQSYYFKTHWYVDASVGKIQPKIGIR